MKLYSDDFGYNRQVDKGIIRLIRRNKLFGASVLTTMVTALSLRWLTYTLNRKKNFILGLHINLIEGKPVQHFLQVRSLVDREGKFFPLLFFVLRLFLGKISRSQIRDEIESQLSILSRRGLKVRMFDSHQHTHALSPVAEIVVAIAEKQNIPYIRSFASIRNYSVRARLTYLFIKSAAFLSYFLAYKKFGLPATWKSNRDFDWTVMSWESNTFDIDSIQKNLPAVRQARAAFVIHPYLPYDTNKSYRSFIK